MNIRYAVRELPDLSAYQTLWALAWGGAGSPSLQRLEHSLTWVCAYDGPQLIGFVNVAWDGGVHAFLLDTTVHPEFQRQGVGRELVRRAAGAARECEIDWLHVDFEPHLRSFYRACGFRATEAGLIYLT
ncbi:N-acetyltransferase [Deinococcus psychrotolerans]|uniref:N-acetyltransferase n=1 Tax=Deinococcus psychrotolerans TaxID=2489213 RepID=A0A3G8YKY0_9DEIO|nr:GNAT family N-acetyltransferase [Deinococcus psychrotolerans]AZI41746.1 N-acetyltransferase [Deinococcus psychrotolerans]